jgi:alkylation response protein AidB-like acyl-CoA dehydrogenase
VQAGGTPGPAASIGKVHQGALNQRIQLLAADLLGAGATAWSGATPFEVSGMLRSRANTIEGGTTEVNKNILGERVLGLPREPDPWADTPWEEIPRS